MVISFIAHHLPAPPKSAPSALMMITTQTTSPTEDACSLQSIGYDGLYAALKCIKKDQQEDHQWEGRKISNLSKIKVCNTDHQCLAGPHYT